MKDNDGRSLDHQTLEAIRIRAVRQIQAGARPVDVAEALGMSKQAVYGWLAKYREGGEAALAAKPVPGPKRKMSGRMIARLYALIVGVDPRQYEFELGLWTREMVRELIRREFGVRLSKVSVGRLLRSMGLSPQRPLWRAYQQNPEAVERWKAEDYPAIAAEAKKAGAVIYFGDEAAVHSTAHAGTTWAPVGRTPVVRATGARFKVNLVSAVSPTGQLRFMATDARFTADSFITFCRRLLEGTDRPVFLIVDGHPTHKAKKVKAFVASTGGRLRLFLLPGYSPELNPDEQVWNHVKTHKISRTVVNSVAELRAMASSALHSLAKTPRLVRGFFHHPDCRYAAAT